MTTRFSLLATPCLLASLLLGTGCIALSGGSESDPGPDAGVSPDALLQQPPAPVHPDGEACSYTSWDCNPDCEASCGISASCTDLCCPEHTNQGVYTNGVCGEAPPVPQCGNGQCQGFIGESYATCPVDCPAQPPQPSTASLTLQNNSSSWIQYVYISGCSETTWGANQLTGGIGPAANHSWALEPGCWDVLATDLAQTHRWSAYGTTVVAGLGYAFTLTDANVDPATP